MMSEGLAECEWISGVLESAVYQDHEPSLHRTEIDIITRRAHGDRHEGRTAFCRLTRPHCMSSMRKVLSITWYENRRGVSADGQHKNYA